MNIFPSGKSITSTVPFASASGDLVTPTALSYRLLTEDGTELVASTVVSLVQDATSVDVTIDAQFHDLGTELRGLRTIELTMETAAGTVVALERYVIESSGIIDFGVNSFQTYDDALLESSYMIDVDTWQSETPQRQRSALIEAYTNLGRLNYKTAIALREMTPDELALVDSRLLVALKKAQIAEANFLLGGESVGDKRRLGLLSESVGESSQMYRSGKPLKLPVSEKALGYLSGYISWTIRLDRC